ncbi:E3 ubiquitin-protein ligase RNF126-like [Branchiostoma floridae x Branchiostoma belcheri]
MSLEEAVQRYRRTERGMTVTVLGLGEQVVSQRRVYDPTTLQEHILEHTVEEAFAKYPMDGFTVKLPGGRTVPLEMPLDPWSWTFQNIIFQLHPANHGDSTWLWRVTHSENPGGGRYCIEVNMHSVGRGVTRVPDNPDDRGSGLDCCICQDTQPGGLLVETSCRHKFHEICLFKWLQEQDVCPLCKRRILTS